MAQEINIKVNVIRDPDLGHEIILPTMRDLDEEEYFWNERREEIEKASNNEMTSKDKSEKLSLCAKALNSIAKKRQYRENGLQISEERAFIIRIPTYGEVFDAQGESEKTINGEIVTDNRTFMKLLLPRCLKGMSDTDVMDLSPVMAMYLWRKVETAMGLNTIEDRLPFLLQRSGLTLKDN